ncbi:hypothetical protein ILUMI_08656 [Ignelater luminosus]|uniref:Serpin domain-containing protein n=1 Tax=Ignelater luminosus TaxID=2038154 RepID=A0A8K0D190_IGNLU|nr:hypothetical protein ILUMI_08656 [Ignelater luminosus]
MRFLLLFVLGSFYLSLADRSDDVLKQFSKGYDAFTADVYKELIKSNTKNLIFSPLSVNIALTLVTSGAREETAKELLNALRLPEDPQQLRETFAALSIELRPVHQYNLSCANKIYVKNGIQVSDQFKKAIVTIFNTHIQNIDFSKNIETANQINKWVEDETENKIRNLVDPYMLDEDMYTVLINAIHFHGIWMKQFDPSSTIPYTFRLNLKDFIQTPMMMAIDTYGYYESFDLNAKFLKLDYGGGDVSMHIVLPNDITGLGDVEKKLSQVFVPPQYKNTKVHVLIPKITIESQMKFKPILQAMGVRSAFEDYANFGGILVNQASNLKISEIVQKSFVEVTEEGTTAAAATAMFQTSRLSELADSPKEFYADHPFMFYLRLNAMGINFFVGRYVSPSP